MTDPASGHSGYLHRDAAEALRVETEFLSGVEANLEAAKGYRLRGTRWRTVREDDGGAVRAMMAERRMHDRELLKRLPHNRRLAVHGYERRWVFWTRLTGMAAASVVSPVEHLLSAGAAAAPPLGLSALVEHVRKLVGESKVPCLIGVCSPTGFAPEVLESRLEIPNVTVVLVEPRGGGGWRVRGVGTEVPEDILALFDPEAGAQKLSRVRREIEARSAELLTGSLSASAVAARLDLPGAMVARVFEQAARNDPELRVSRRAGEVLLYRGAPVQAQEDGSMSVVDRIRQLFSREGDESAKINVLSERRAALAQRRDRIYEDIGKLEVREAELLAQGRASPSTVVRRRLAAQLAQLRKDIARQNTTANMLNQQINIISTDIHNLTLIRQGQMAKLPSTEALTENAVKAEEMLESLKADVELVSNLETGLADVVTGDEEMAILKEFEEPQRAARTETDAPEDVRQAMADFEAPAPERQKRPAEPE